jgi:hypothetical protein
VLTCPLSQAVLLQEAAQQRHLIAEPLFEIDASQVSRQHITFNAVAVAAVEQRGGLGGPVCTLRAAGSTGGGEGEGGQQVSGAVLSRMH